MSGQGQAAPSDYSVDWRSLLGHLGALKAFTRAEPATLTPKSFERLNAAPLVDAPPVRFHWDLDGTRLAYRTYRAAASRQVVVLVHGPAGFGDQMHAIARTLAQANLATCYTLDMRGHGRSDGRRGRAVRRLGQPIDDLSNFLVLVRQANPGAKVCLAGHSTGGGLALGVSRTAAGQQVDSYLLLAPELGFGCPASRPAFGGWASARTGRLKALTLANALGVGIFNGKQVVEFTGADVHDARYVKSWSYNSLLSLGAGRWRPKAASISSDKPVLVLTGDNDECIDPSRYAEALASAAPHACVRTVGPIGHWDLLVDETAISEIGAWIAENALADFSRLTPEKAKRKAAKRLKEAS